MLIGGRDLPHEDSLQEETRIEMWERLGQAASFRKVCEKPLHRRYPYITQMLEGIRWRAK
jgi:hypothetical protein